WEEALAIAGDAIRAAAPERLGVFCTSRGVTNEVYYSVAKAARFLGTNNVDNSARICHSPSTVALKETIGFTASTCSYSDWIGTDLLVFLGSDVANNQPVTTKYVYYAKKAGTRVAVVNAYREPGLERYWIPSVLESAVFGTKLADDFFLVHHGGDLAFLHGAMKHVLANGWADRDYLNAHVLGFEELEAVLAREGFESLEAACGASREEMLRFARMVAEARSAVFVWSMGLTQHLSGVENVKAVAQLALLRGFVGPEKCGLMPIRGHSGVQGGAEVGCVPNQYGAGFPVCEENAERFEGIWGFRPPTAAGLDCAAQLDAAGAGELDILYCIGGNFLETLPQPDRVRASLERIPLRIHQDIVVTTQMLAEPAETVLLLPAMTRYEQPGGGTETSTERRIYFSPEIPGRRIGEARAAAARSWAMRH
ncbi:MAG: molybdopterin-dependent oxidoreductase, partial [Candidatus Methylomirabilis sp.]|nr:molybdopterin-dependent oxidoreductase [Deltaproteobacteria bacterium]